MLYHYCTLLYSRCDVQEVAIGMDIWADAHASDLVFWLSRFGGHHLCDYVHCNHPHLDYRPLLAPVPRYLGSQ